MAKGEVCCICSTAPVLYFSNGKFFCGKHKKEATNLARLGLQAWNRYMCNDDIPAYWVNDTSKYRQKMPNRKAKKDDF